MLAKVCASTSPVGPNPDDDDVMVGGGVSCGVAPDARAGSGDSRPRPNCRAFRPVLRFSGKWPWPMPWWAPGCADPFVFCAHGERIPAQLDLEIRR